MLLQKQTNLTDMTKKYAILSFFAISLLIFFSCTDNEDEEYTSISPVTVDLTQVPYTNLSDYHFFEGEMKNQNMVPDIFRAGIWKPRTRPGSFEGIGEEGLKWMEIVRHHLNIPITTEVGNAAHVELALKHNVDVLWVGARTTVNPFAVQEIADALKGVDIPVMIKNPMNPDLQLWIGALERMHAVGINKLAAIHRGFSDSYDKRFRNKPNWSMPIHLKREWKGMEVINDPSHIVGNREGILETSQRAINFGLDGLMIETHDDPVNAWSDAKQQVTPK